MRKSLLKVKDLSQIMKRQDILIHIQFEGRKVWSFWAFSSNGFFFEFIFDPERLSKVHHPRNIDMILILSILDLDRQMTLIF